MEHRTARPRGAGASGRRPGGGDPAGAGGAAAGRWVKNVATCLAFVALIL